MSPGQRLLSVTWGATTVSLSHLLARGLTFSTEGKSLLAPPWSSSSIHPPGWGRQTVPCPCCARAQACKPGRGVNRGSRPGLPLPQTHCCPAQSSSQTGLLLSLNEGKGFINLPSPFYTGALYSELAVSSPPAASLRNLEGRLWCVGGWETSPLPQPRSRRLPAERAGRGLAQAAVHPAMSSQVIPFFLAGAGLSSSQILAHAMA